MAGVGGKIKIQVNLQEIERLKKEIADVKKQILNLSGSDVQKYLDGLNQKYQDLNKQLQAAGEEAMKMARDIDSLNEKYNQQKSTIEQYENQIISLTEQLKNSSKGVSSPEYQELEKDLHKIESAYEKATQEAENMQQAISQKMGITGNIDKFFDGVEKNSDNFIDAINRQREAIKKMELDYINTREKMTELGKRKNYSPENMAEYEKLKKLMVEIRGDMSLEKKDLSALEKAYKQFIDSRLSGSQKEITLLTQRKQILNEMGKLELAGKSGTDEYKQLEQQLSKVGTAINIVNKNAKALTTAGSADLAGFIQGITGIAGAFSAAQGVMSLFTKDNEKLAAIQTKLQAAMSITIGLQQVSNTLHVTSAFRMNIASKATLMWRSSINKLSVALGISNIQAQILMATLTVGLSLAITGVVILLERYNSEQDKAIASNKKFSEAVGSNISSLRSNYEKLRKEWAAANGDIQKQEELLLKNGDAYNNLGVKIRDVNDANNIFVNNTDNFIKSLELRAKAAASMELASEKYKEAIQKMIEAEGSSPTPGVIDWFSPVLSGKKLFDVFNHSQLESDSKKAEEDARDYIIKSLGYSDENVALMNQMGLDATETISENSKAWYQKIRDDQQKIMDENLPGSNKFNAAKIQRDAAAKMLQKWDKTDFKGQESAANKAKKLEQELLALQDKLNNEQLQQELSSQQKLIDKQEDGFKKQYAQNELNYKKELQQIKEYEDSKAKERNEAILKFGSSKIPVELSTENVKKQTEILKTEALSSFSKINNDILKSLTDKYQSYADQRLEIEKRYNKDIEILIQQRDKSVTEEQRSLLNRSIAKATADKGKELMSFDFDRLKESPEYVRAFEDLKNTSSETLNSLLTQLEDAKQTAAKVLSPDQLREYTSTIQSIMDELTERNPYKALIDKKKELAEASTELARSEKQLKDVQSGFGVITNLAVVNGKLTASYLSEADAVKNVNKAKDKYTKANNNVVVAEKKILGQIEELNSALSNLGNSIGGTSGLIIGLMGDIGLFATTSIEGISKVADKSATAISNIEKASVILTIISTAIQLMQKLDELMPDAYDKYEKYDEKIQEINRLKDAVTQYELAVLKANQADKSWFGKDALRDLHNLREYHDQVWQAYDKKANEAQAKYQNQKGGGWLSKTLNYGLIGGIDKIFGTNILGNKYEEQLVKAKDNLRIETRKKSSGWFGIGGKSQKTENLVDWAKNNGFGDLFDKDGWINVSAADAILGQYGDKLVGQTKETLEEMKALKEQYDEYIKQLREYVNSMYEPLADNMVSAIWDWLDKGKSALDSFKDYAKDTFRDIVSDMIKTIILKDVFGDYKDKIAGLYEEYSKGNLTEEELSDAIAKETAVVVDRYDKTLPMLQDTVNAINQGIKDSTGIDLKDTNSSQSTTKGGFETMTQDQAGEMNGRLTGIMETNLRSEGYLKSISEWNQPIGDRIDLSSIAMPLNLINESSSRIEQMIEENKSIAINSYYELKDINKNTKELYQMNERLGNIEKNTKGLAPK